MEVLPLFLAFKELKHAKFRYAMMTAIILLIAWLVFILSGLGNGLSTLSAATIKNIDADYVVYEKTAGATFTKSILSEDLEKQLQNQKNVEKVAPFGSSIISVGKTKSKNADSKKDVALIGVEPASFLIPKVIEGSTLTTNEPNGVLVNDTLKDAGYKIGDTLFISNSNLTVKIIGFIQNETFNHLPAMFTIMNTWRDFQYAAPGSTNNIQKPVQAFFLQGANIEPEKSDKNIDSIETVTKKEAISGMPGFKEENGTIMMMLAFCIVISAFIIAVFFYVITMQKTQQFGVMKAMGASNGFIARSIIAQVFLLSVIGIVGGVALTYLTAALLPENMPFNLDPLLLITYAVVLLIIALGSSLISVRQITKIDPLIALGRVE